LSTKNDRSPLKERGTKWAKGGSRTKKENNHKKKPPEGIKGPPNEKPSRGKRRGGRGLG